MRPSSRLPSPFALVASVTWLLVTALWWALAFAPLPAPPEWVEGVRSVCFGTLANGLPDTYGWVLLVMGPLSMLAFLLAVWGREVVDDVRYLAGLRLGRVALIVLALGVLAAGGWIARRIDAGLAAGEIYASPVEPRPLPESYPETDRPAPPLALTDQTGRPVRLAELAGRPVIVTFAYAHCETVCPLIVEAVREAADRLGAKTGAGPAVLVVTLDPWRDTPRTLPALAELWELEPAAGLHVLSGEVDEVLDVLEAWEVPYTRNRRSGDIGHPALVYLVDGTGRIAYTFQSPDAGWLVEATRRLAAG